MRLNARLGGAAIAALLATGMILGSSAAANAHDQLVGTTPTSGGQLDASPSEVTLQFSDTLMAVGYKVTVTGSDGTSVTAADAVQSGRGVSVALTPELPDDEYRVVWRVVSSDGHPIDGNFRFTVGEGAPAGTASPEPSAAPSAAPAEETPAAAEAPSEPSGGPAWGRTALIAGLGLLIGGGGYALLTRRGRRAARDADPS